jgi:UDP-N-acetylglucosamine 2-epimerase (non-hydrolysing)/GDP/UDP-N,N'-diacetylbacillosamine 2-epimerase (hydrolysing)
VASLGQLRYISLMNEVDVVVGNSSSGIYEAPSLNTPSVDIGDRQKGRQRAASVFHATAERTAIAAAIAQALRRGRQPTINPYGDGEAGRRIAETIAAVPDFKALLKKGFHETAATGVVP